MRRTVLPVHALTGLTAIGIIGDKPVFPVLGGSGPGDPPPADPALVDPPKPPADPPPAEPPKPPPAADPPAEPPPADPPKDSPDGTDWKAEAEKWKTTSRKHEDRAKQNADKAKQFDDLKRSQMSDQEKAVDQARSDAKAEAAREFGARLVDAEVRAISAGRMSDEQRTTLLDGLDRSRFLTDSGEVDADKVRVFVDAVAPAVPIAPVLPPTGGARMGQGRRPASDGSTLASGRERYEQKHSKRTTT